MRLFDYNPLIEDAMTRAIDIESGEILDETAFEEFNNLQMQKDEKTENVLLYIKELRAGADAMKAEKKNIDSRIKAFDRRAEWLTEYVRKSLDGEKFSTPKVSVSYRKSEQVEIDDGAFLADEYLTFKMPEPNKVAIKKALKAGEKIEGCRLVEHNNMQIK